MQDFLHIYNKVSDIFCNFADKYVTWLLSERSRTIVYEAKNRYKWKINKRH